MIIWQSPDWPQWRTDATRLQAPLAAARLAQGRMLGMAQTLRLGDRGSLDAEAWASEALATARIEGEELELHSVRASAARRLGLDAPATRRREERTEATLDVLEAAISHPETPLSEELLCGWQAALFPTGRSGVRPIAVGRWRDHGEPMQIVTPRLGRPDIVHYEAPPSARVPQDMAALIAWFNRPMPLDGLVRAAIAHIWFEAIHPFEDGNGRIGRALAERAIAQDQPACARLFSLSEALWQHRSAYYAELQAVTGAASLDATGWTVWFLCRLSEAFDASLQRMQAAVDRHRFHREVDHRQVALTPGQRKALDRLFQAAPGEFLAGMSTRAYVSLTGTSRATAWRELTELVSLGLLQSTGQGRGTRYHLATSLLADLKQPPAQA
jgi:Fic family protein